MTANEALKEGRTEEARAILEAEIKRGDRDPGTYLMLFMATIKLEDFAAAKNVLDEVTKISPDLAPLAKRLTSCAGSEWTYVNRHRDPNVAQQRASFGPPQPFAFAYVKAMALHAAKDHAGAAAALAEAKAARPKTPGILHTTAGDRVPFSDLYDTDDLTGGTLPLFYEGKIYDVPYADMRTVTFHPAEDPFEVIWPRVTFELLTGTKGVVAMPALYAGSSSDADPFVRLGRTTTWDHERGYAVAKGLRDFWVIGPGGEQKMMGLVHFAKLELGQLVS